MAKVFRCSDAGVQCRAKIVGASEDEVLDKAVEHARKKHGIDLTQSVTLVKFAQSAVKDEPAEEATEPAEEAA